MFVYFVIIIRIFFLQISSSQQTKLPTKRTFSKYSFTKRTVSCHSGFCSVNRSSVFIFVPQHTTLTLTFHSGQNVGLGEG